MGEMSQVFCKFASFITKMKKKCVIVGSGLGGLACGVAFARSGYDVTVLEQQAQVGGCLQCFVRGNAKFETGMHFIGSALPGQTLYRLLDALDVMDDITLSPLDTAAYEIFSFAGQRFSWANGREAFIEALARDFPREKDNLNRFCDWVERTAGASRLHSMSDVEGDTALSTAAQLHSIDEVLDRVTANPMLRSVLCGNIPLYAAERGRTPFSTMAFIMDFYNQSALRVVGGSDAIARSLVSTLRRLGGEVLTRQRVNHIECDNSRVRGVTTDHGLRLNADVVIADVHPARLIELVDSPLLRPAYRQRVAALPNTVGGFSVYLKFKPGQMPYLNSNFYGYAQLSPWDCEKYTLEDWPRGYLMMHLAESPRQQWATSGVLLSYMRWEEMLPWQGTRVGHRGADYEAFKAEHAERLLNLVERDFPGLRNSVEAYYTSTPLTYRDYTGTERGSMYGIAKDITLGPSGRVHHRTKVPGLLLTGQNINSHGILGVLVGAAVTCAELGVSLWPEQQ